MINEQSIALIDRIKDLAQDKYFEPEVSESDYAKRLRLIWAKNNKSFDITFRSEKGIYLGYTADGERWLDGDYCTAEIAAKAFDWLELDPATSRDGWIV